MRGVQGVCVQGGVDETSLQSNCMALYTLPFLFPIPSKPPTTLQLGRRGLPTVLSFGGGWGVGGGGGGGGEAKTLLFIFFIFPKMYQF